ncbi:Acyl-homoserine-lactone synthase LuxM [Vibrio aerogenes CECT 7868]|uniref:acyl-homoserine-lactone synthase n=2 Tax=Vibrio aerogenes TaxID=92172 RepID=A0A1M5ZUI5_9VIBR|nr:acyl-homoserine-lactone synthase [Vibrio aerogenes]SHI27925.1 Acyl-homoserine-lactone synthase LuxM [Vibrio aerogenes CECT 7868]
MSIHLLYKCHRENPSFIITKNDLFFTLKEHGIDQSRHLLKIILNVRLNQLRNNFPEMEHLNIASKINSEEYKNILGTPPGFLLDECYYIEQLVLYLYDDFAEFWCDFEIFCIKSRYRTDEVVARQSFFASYDESIYKSRLVMDIEKIESKYLTVYHHIPVSLPDAIVLCNLCTFIKKRKWYEMLYLLDESTNGCHFLLTIDSPISGVDLIVSTAKIQYWDQCQWLYFSPFFQSDNWVVMPKETTINDMVSSGLLNGCLDYSNASSFENDLIYSIPDKSKMCEIIRLTVSRINIDESFVLYLAQKRLVNILYEHHLLFGFIIVEQPLIVNYYKTLNHDEYLCTSKSNLLDTGNDTYKGIWLIDKLKKNFDRLSYDGYMDRVLSNENVNDSVKLEVLNV